MNRIINVYQDLLILPSALFLYFNEHLQGKLSPKELGQYIRGRLEEESLLELEQIAWGHFYDKKSGELFVFYTSKKEVQSYLNTANQMNKKVKWVVPSFALISNLSIKEKPSSIFIKDAESDCQIVFPNKKTSIPSELLSSYLSDTRKDKQALDPYFLKAVDLNSKTRNYCVLWENNEVISRFALSEKKLLALDLQDEEYLFQIRSELKQKQITRASLIGNGLLFFILLVYQLFSWSNSWQYNASLEQVESQRKQVSEIESQDKLATVLRSFSKGAFRPFDWLLYLNDLRPPNMSISVFRIGEDGRMTFQAKAELASEMNLFQQILEKDIHFKSVTFDNVRSKTQGVEFGVVIKLQSRNPKSSSERPRS